MSTQIRVSLDTKSALENVQANKFRVKTHSDAIDSLIRSVSSLENKLDKLNVDWGADRRRSELEDVCLGEDRKKDLVSLQKELNLKNTADLIDILLLHFHSALQVDKTVLFELATLTKR